MYRKATAADLDSIWKIYDAVLTREEAGLSSVGWVRNIYPTPEIFARSLAAGELFVCETEDGILAAARINKIQGEEYRQAGWTIPAEDHQVMVLHTLAVAPFAQSKGIGKGFVQFYEQYALQNGCTVARLDTNVRNTPGRRLYPSLGYQEAGVVPCIFNGIENVLLCCYEKAL